MRPHERRFDELRPLTFRRRYTRQAPGSVLVKLGRTTVLCTCCIEPSVPPFLTGKGKGWLSAGIRDAPRQHEYPQAAIVPAK